MQLNGKNQAFHLLFVFFVVFSTNACTFRKKDLTDKNPTAPSTPPAQGTFYAPVKVIPNDLKELITTSNTDEFSKDEIDPLIDKVQNLNMPDQDGMTLLELSVRFNQFKVAQRLLAKGASPFATNQRSKRSIVQIATELNRQEILKLLQTEQERQTQIWLDRAELLSLAELNKLILTNEVALTTEFENGTTHYTQRMFQLAINKIKEPAEVRIILDWSSRLDEGEASEFLYEALVHSSPDKQRNFVRELPRATVLNILKVGLTDFNFAVAFAQKVSLMELMIEKYKVNYTNPGANQIIRIGDSPSAMTVQQLHKVFLFRWSKINPDHEALTRRHLLNLVKIFDPERRISRPGEFIRIRVRPPSALAPEFCMVGSEECYRNEIYYLALVRAVQSNLQDSMQAILKTFEILQVTRHPKSPIRMTTLVANPFFREDLSDKLFWRSRNELFQVGFVPQIQFTNYQGQTKLQLHDLQLNPALIMQIAFADLESRENIQQLLYPHFLVEPNQQALALAWTFEAPLQELLPKIKMETLEKNCQIEKIENEPMDMRKALASCSLTTSFSFAEIQNQDAVENAFSTQLNLKQNETDLTVEALLAALFDKNQILQIKKNALRSLQPYLKL